MAATQCDAVKCTVCGATDFEVISQEMIEKIAAVERAPVRPGGHREETGAPLDIAEDGIEIGKEMMVEMISTYSPPVAGPAKHNLNEVSPLTARPAGET